MVFVWAGDEGEEVPGEDDSRYPTNLYVKREFESTRRPERNGTPLNARRG